MFLLIRSVSSYTGITLLLGAFTRRQGAENARIAYLKKYARDPASDPWYDQRGYEPPGLVDGDLTIFELPLDEPVSDEVYVVSRLQRGCGQVIRRFDSVHTTSQAAEARVRRIAEWADERSFPPQGVWQRVSVNLLLSDAAADQPNFC